MAFTIQQLQTFSNTKPELRYVTEQIIDYLQANPPGSHSPGSGLALESYQNTAMSAPVMAYVFKDEDDNIFRVYEPIRNNDVSRKTFAYADSIDFFPFDSADCFNATLQDVKLVGVGTDVLIQGSNLETMVIDGGGKTGLQISATKIKGSYGGGCPNNAELFITGDNFRIESSNIYNGILDSGSFIDSPGDDCLISALTTLNWGNGIFVQGHSNLYLGDGLMWEDYSYIFIYNDGCKLYDFLIGGSVNFHAPNLSTGAGNTGFVIGDVCEIGTPTERFTKMNDVRIGNRCVIKPTSNNTDTLNKVEFGIGCNVTTTGNKTNAEYKNLGGTTYELGEAAGAATLTAV